MRYKAKKPHHFSISFSTFNNAVSFSEEAVSHDKAMSE
jgi:hypothetical protein